MKVRKTVYIEEGIWRKLKVFAANNGNTISQQIYELIKEKNIFVTGSSNIKDTSEQIKDVFEEDKF